MLTNRYPYFALVLYIIILFTISFPVYSKSNDASIHSDKPGVLSQPATGSDKDQNNKSATLVPRGKMLYQNHCRVCHDSNAHVRNKKKAKSKADIHYWVSRWSSHLNLKWNQDDRTQVVEFLNTQYYKY